MKTSVLVTSIGRKVPLIKAVKDAANRAGIEAVIGQDVDSLCLARRFVDRFTERGICDIYRWERPWSIIPTRNDDCMFVSTTRGNTVMCMVSPFSAVSKCTDKKAFAELLEENGIRTPGTSGKFPLWVVKERFGAGSRGMLIGTKEEVESHAATMDCPIFQEHIFGKEYTVDVYVGLDGRAHGAIARTRDIIRDGESVVTTTTRHVQLESICSSMAEKIGIYGHACIQVIETPEGELYPIDINPRVGGCSTLSFAAGLDSLYWFMLESQGKPLPPFKRVDKELTLVRHPEDYIF